MAFALQREQLGFILNSNTVQFFPFLYSTCNATGPSDEYFTSQLAQNYYASVIHLLKGTNTLQGNRIYEVRLWLHNDHFS